MLNVLKIAARNLARYRRRTLLTSLLIVIGMVAVLLFVAITGSFKAMMIGQFTDSVLGHMEIHRKGYVASIDNLPLNLNIKAGMVGKIEEVLKRMDAIEAYSPRVKLGAMFSNFVETTSIRINGIDPQREAATTPLMPGRLIEGAKGGALLSKGEVLIPALLAKGMQVKVGDTVVLVATNRDGSVNGKTFKVKGVMEGVTGPGGRDGYIHVDDARELLRMKEPEISEIAIRLKNPAQLDRVSAQLARELAPFTNKEGKPMLEVHTWADLSPFSNIARMIDIMTVFIKIMLVSIVLVSVMNVMVMAVYERIREIGTISAIGTPPGKILALFLSEGLLLGLAGTAAGTLISLAVIQALNIWKITFSFGIQKNLLLTPAIHGGDVAAIAAMVVVVATLASLQPAWKASRMDPIAALRHV
ncbi:MAG: ABC transporter permease [Sulfuricellaceae bacterium]